MTPRGRRRTGSWLAGYEPLDEWSRAEVLREVLRGARGLDTEEVERDVLPRLRRLTDEQRREALELQLRDRGVEPNSAFRPQAVVLNERFKQDRRPRVDVRP